MTLPSGKGPEAFRTISEASAELGVPQHVLRFWETKFDFVQPTKRAGGRRFYRPADLEVLRGVRALLHDEGYTIKGVQRLHKEGGLKRLTAALEPAPAQEPERAVPVAALDGGAPRSAAAQVEPLAELRPQDVLVAAASPAEPPAERPARHVLDPEARTRLTAVLRDLETAREAIGLLLDKGSGSRTARR